MVNNIALSPSVRVPCCKHVPLCTLKIWSLQKEFVNSHEKVLLIQPLLLNSMEQLFFAFSLIIEGTTEKMLQFMMPFQAIYNRNFGFIEQKMYF